MDVDTVPERAATDSLGAIFRRFLGFGVNAWGGPVAQIGLLRRELVDEERWVEPEHFNRTLALYQALPGPEATELCIHLGVERRGRVGGLVAGLGFVLPGFALMLLASLLYVRVGIEGVVAVGLFAGCVPVVAALVLRAVHRIGSHALADRWLWTIAAIGALAQAAGVAFFVPLGGGASAYALARRGGWPARVAAVVVLGSVVALSASTIVEEGGVSATVDATRSAAPGALQEPSTAQVAVVGLRAGMLTFGGAYTVIPFVERDAVRDGRWITQPQFLDGLAIASVLPAPLVIFTTFVGYLAGGLGAALVITIGVFAPAFIISLAGHRQLERAIAEPRLHALLDGVTAAVVGLIAMTAVTITASAVSGGGVLAAVILVGALVVLHRWRGRASMLVVMLAGGAIGVVEALAAR